MSRYSDAAFEPAVSAAMPGLPEELRRASDGCANLLRWANLLLSTVVQETDDESDLKLNCEFAFKSWHDIHCTLAEVSAAVITVASELAKFGPVQFGSIHAASAHHAALEFVRNIVDYWNTHTNCSRWMQVLQQTPENERVLTKSVYLRITIEDVAALKEIRKEFLKIPSDQARVIRAAIVSEVAKAAAFRSEPKRTKTRAIVRKEVPKADDDSSPDIGKVGSSNPKWSNWAIGMETRNKWHLFRNFRGEWRQQRTVKGITKGRQAKLLEAFAKEGGFLSWAVALKLEGEIRSPGALKQSKNLIKPEISKLRAIIRAALTKVDSDADPLPYEHSQDGWRARIRIGYAVQEDGEKIGGECRLRFKDRDALTPDELAER